MRKIKTYCCCPLLLVILLFACQQRKPELPVLKETFSNKDLNPFGSNVMFRQVSQLFKDNKIRIKKERIEKSLGNNDDTTALFISVSKNFYLSDDDLRTALNFVNKGNSMLIVSENFDTTFLKTMGLQIEQQRTKSQSLDDMKNTGVQLNPEFYYDSTSYDYFYLPLDHHFGSENDSVPNVLGRDEYGRANFVVLFYGMGRFYIHCEPKVFSNYFLLQKNNYKYLQQVLAFMPVVPAHVFWDDFYNKRNSPPAARDAKTGLAVLLQFPAMAWAFWLVLLLLVVYLLFGSKRRQRIIEILPPNQNTSVAFAETISRLYLQQKDNRGMADKMILYFLEQVRNQYFLNTHVINELFLINLSRKTNMPLADTEQLFKTIQTIQQSASINDGQLLNLNEQMTVFYKNKGTSGA